MPQIRRIAILILLAAVLFAAPSFAQTVLAGQTPGGAFYTIAVPDRWNGGLVIYNHGFSLTPVAPGPTSARWRRCSSPRATPSPPRATARSAGRCSRPTTT